MAEEVGLVWVNSKITKPNEVSPGDFLSFYADHHVPDVVQVPGHIGAAMYTASKPDAGRPYLILYRLSDMKALESEELHDLFEQEDVIAMREKGNFEIRGYRPLKERFEGADGAKHDPPASVLLAVTADTEGAHLTKEIITIPVERHPFRSKSYKLLFAQQRGAGATDASNTPPYLTLHEFDDSGSTALEDAENLSEVLVPEVRKQVFRLVRSY